MKKIGLCITGSFCTFHRLLSAVDELIAANYDITTILSYNVSQLDTRFFSAADFEKEIEIRTGKKPIKDIVTAEPIGTNANLELMLVAPCTGNTLAKIAHGITDTPVTMAVKATLRNNRPVLLSVSSNDALGANAKNLGILMNTKNIYFVPFGQDNPCVKSNSLIADLSKIVPACNAALESKQLQPLLN